MKFNNTLKRVIENDKESEMQSENLLILRVSRDSYLLTHSVFNEKCAKVIAAML